MKPRVGADKRQDKSDNGGKSPRREGGCTRCAIPRGCAATVAEAFPTRGMAEVDRACSWCAAMYMVVVVVEADRRDGDWAAQGYASELA